jgi:hypothetical protein
MKGLLRLLMRCLSQLFNMKTEPYNYLRFNKRPPGKKPPPRSEIDLRYDADRDGFVFEDDQGVETPIGGTTIEADTISEATEAAGVTVDGVKLKDSQVYTDVINEKTAAAGVTADGVKLKDGAIYLGDALLGQIVALGFTTPRTQAMLDADGEINLRPSFATSIPVNGGTVTTPTQDKDHIEEINPAGTLASLTVEIPVGNNVGRLVQIISSQEITALTITVLGGGTVYGAQTTIAADGFGSYRQISATTWARVG